MFNTRDYIIKKALLYIDEVYPASGVDNAFFFPIEELLDDAARWIIRIIPQRVLGEGYKLPISGFQPAADGSGMVTLPDDFVRLLYFRVQGWQRPVLTPIYDNDPRYVQQFQPALRGGEAKPVVVICENGRRLEYFSSSKGIMAKLQDARYYGFTKIDDDYPERLADITAWKTAELALAITNDAALMQMCTSRIQEILQTL